MTNDPVRARRLHVLMGLLFAVASGSAWAQVQPANLGRTMDANTQVGSGGSNHPITGYTPVNGNDVVSGNVSGLKGFHAPVGTASPYEFRAPLGTSTLENFARQSAPVSGALSSVNDSYFLPSRVVSGGGLTSTPMGGGFDSQYVPRTAISPLTPIAPSSNQLGLPGASIDRVPSAAALAPGSPGTLLSSPIFTMRDLSTPPEPSEGQRSTNLLQTNGTTPNTAQPNGLDILNGQNNNNTNNANTQDQQDNTDDTGNVARQTRTNEQRNAAIGPRDKPESEPTGVYRDLLGELRRAQAEAEAKDNKDAAQAASVGVNVVPGSRMPAKGSMASAAGQKGTATVKPRGSNLITDEDIDPLTGQPRIGAGLTPRNRGAATRPGGLAGDALSPRGLEDLPESTLSSGSRVKPLSTLVGPREGTPTGPFDLLLARAENLLKDGKYLDAAATYEEALVRQPDNALALVGKAHAELGAGAYQSSAYDLKFVFTRNPQMVGVQYKMDTFISPQRRETLQRDLSSLSVDNKDMANTAEFLLSYLYYQTGQQQRLRAELQRWGDREGHDSWQSVLRRAWLSNAQAAPGNEGGGPK